MAVIRCAGCGNEIENEGSACPICHYPLRVDRSRLNGGPSFLNVPSLFGKVLDYKEKPHFSVRRALGGVIFGLCVFSALGAGFLYYAQVPSANAFMQEALDSYASLGPVGIAKKIPKFISDEMLRSQGEDIADNQIDSTSAEPSSTTVPVAMAKDASNTQLSMTSNAQGGTASTSAPDDSAIQIVMDLPNVKTWESSLAVAHKAGSSLGGSPAFSVVGETTTTVTVHVFENLPDHVVTFGFYDVNKATGVATVSSD